MSRREDLKKYGAPVRMPELPEWGEHIVGYLFEFGPVGKEEPISPLTIESWARLLGIDWEPWEARLLYTLSKEYYGETHQATKWNADPPWPGCIPDFQATARIKNARRDAEEERRIDALFRDAKT